MLVLHIAREAKLVNMVQGGPFLFDQRLEGWKGVNYMDWRGQVKAVGRACARAPRQDRIFFREQTELPVT